MSDEKILNNSNSLMADSEFFYERETEYFGFTPFQFLDKVGELVVKAVFTMFDRLVHEILEPNVPFLSIGQIEGVGQWSALVETRFGRNYELFESYTIKNVLVIPDEFILPHHRNVTLNFKMDEGCLDQELEKVTSRLQELKSFEAYLDREEAQLGEEEKVLASMEFQLDTLKEKLAAHELNSFEQITLSLTDQLTSLKSIVTNTIEEGRNIYAFEESSLTDHRWTLDHHRIQKSTSLEKCGELKCELEKCLQMASFSDVSTLKMIL